jgi:hypothetical protein
VDPVRPQRPAVDQPRVALDEGGAVSQPVPRVVGGLDAAHRDQYEPVADSAVQPLEHVKGALLERRPGQAARLSGRLRVADQSVSGDRGVGGNDAVQAELDGEVGDRVDVLVGQIRSDLHEQRDLAAGRPVESVADRPQQRPQVLYRLQVPQPRGVRRADVDDQVVGVRAEPFGALDVVGGGLAVRYGLGLADVDADDGATPAAAAAAVAAAAQSPRHHSRAVIVEPHPVDNGPVPGQPEQPGPRVARLRLGGDRTDLHEAEAERGERLVRRGVLVETGGQAEWAGEVQTERPHSQGRVGCQHATQQPGEPGDHRDDPQPRHARAVRGLRRHPAE